MQQRWTHIFLWILSLVALGYLVYRLIIFDDYALLAVSLGRAAATEWMALVVALLLLPVQLVVESRKWQLMLRGLVDVGLTDSLIQVLTGHVAALVTPYRLGEYPGRLLQMGYSWQQWRAAVGGWRQWLSDWRKWLRVLLLHLLRYGVWMVQFGALLLFCGVKMSMADMTLAIATYYLIITMMPSLPAADVPIKGGWAAVTFAAYTDNIPAVLLTVTMVWLINTIVPTLAGVCIPLIRQQTQSCK